MSASLPTQLTYCTEVPAEWKIQKLKRLFSVSSGDFLAPEEETSDGFPVYGGNGIRGYAAKPNCNGRTLLIGRVGAYCGNVHLVDGDFWYSEHALRVFPIKPFSLDFFKHLIRVIDLNQFANRTAQPLINSSTTTDRYAAVPPLPEQQRIAAYLDASCAAIDAAVAAKRRQLETLDALRSSIISRAVTHGLNGRAALKPSGMDWSPEVPAHWEVQQIKRLCSLVRGQFTHRPRNDPALYDGPYPFIQTGDITAAGKYIRTHSQTLNELGLSASKQFPKGTLVMSIAANIGDVAILDFEACFPDSMIGMIPRRKTNLDFLYYLMRSMRGIMLRSAVQSTQLNLNYVRIGTNFAPVPPLKEQAAIAEYLDAKEHEFQLLSSTIETQIATLTAYRKSLIHECVTGQRRITEADVRAIQQKTPTVATPRD